MAKHILHIDPFGGASGDMILSALLSVGVPISVVQRALDALQLGEIRAQTHQEQRHTIHGLRTVFTDHHNNPVDPYETGRAGEHHHHSRSWVDIQELLTRLPPPVAQLAHSIFEKLARAEAHAHGQSMDQVHFHEVGALDSIADIVAVAAAIDHLQVEHISCGPIPLGNGTIKTAHGLLPAPAPATLFLCREAQVHGVGVNGECTTPTGAAILTTLASEYGPYPEGVIAKIGVGLGKRDPAERANLLRAVLLTPSDKVEVALQPEELQEQPEQLLELRCNLDDETGEMCGYAIEQMLQLGALDAWATPATMKKGRPAVVLHALLQKAQLHVVRDFLLLETSTLGVRCVPVSRWALQRREIEVSTEYGRVRVKQALRADTQIKSKPEFEDCCRLARQHKVPPRLVVQAAQRAAAAGTEKVGTEK